MGKTVKVGTFLKKEREANKLSINDVASKTKINLNILKHLEANALDQLPNKTYVKGFVKSYCKLLSLDINEALDLLEKTYNPVNEGSSDKAENSKTEKEETPVTPKSHTTPPQSNEDEIHEMQDKLTALAQSIFNKKIIVPVLVLAVVAIILKGIVSFFVQLTNEQKELASNKKVKESVIVKEEQDQVAKVDNDPTIKKADENLFDSDANKKLKEEVIKDIEKKKADEQKLAEQKVKEEKEKLAAEKVKEEAEKAKQLAEEKAAAEKKKKEELKKKVVRLNGKFPFKKFYPAPTKMYQALADAVENKSEELLPKKFRNAIESGKQNVFIHATSGDTWISYQSDENEIKRFVLKKGRSVLIKGDVILLFMGNINVAHIFYNNKLVKTKSKTGVKSLIFPQIEASNYELPLFPAFNGVPYKASDYKANMVEQDA